MKITKTGFLKKVCCLILMCLSLTGCVEAVAYLPTLIQAGAGALSGMEGVDVKAALSPGIPPDDVKKIKRVAVVLGTGQSQNPQIPVFGMGGDITSVMADNIALELMNLGFKVVERSSLDKVLKEEELQLSGIVDPKTAAKVGGILGVDAVVLGNITTSQKSEVNSGFMGVGADVSSKQVISNVTMKVVGIQQADVIMIVALSYKKGQQPTDASKTMAIALADKLKNPTEQKQEKTAKESTEQKQEKSNSQSEQIKAAVAPHASQAQTQVKQQNSNNSPQASSQIPVEQQLLSSTDIFASDEYLVFDDNKETGGKIGKMVTQPTKTNPEAEFLMYDSSKKWCKFFKSVRPAAASDLKIKTRVYYFADNYKDGVYNMPTDKSKASEGNWLVNNITDNSLVNTRGIVKVGEHRVDISNAFVEEKKVKNLSGKTEKKTEGSNGQN